MSKMKNLFQRVVVENDPVRRLRHTARKHGWAPGNGITLMDWLDQQLKKGNEAMQIVSRWEEDSLKGQ